MPWMGGVASGAGSVINGILQSNAATDAANIQAKSANNALGLDANVMRIIQQQLDPFLQTGNLATTNLRGALANDSPYYDLDPTKIMGGQAPALSDYLNQAGGSMQQPFLPQSQFQASPGYQYELGQQQQAIQNSAAGKSGALSGNTLKALQQNAQGLAGTDYWTANNNWMNNLMQMFTTDNTNWWDKYNATQQNKGSVMNWLTNAAGMGQNAAANQGAQGVNLAGQAGNNLIGAGNARAAGLVGSTNALSNGFNGAFNAFAGNNNGNGSNMLQYLFGTGGLFGSQGPMFGNAADSSIAAGGPPLSSY